ncbi:UNVERIFIED_CONTAM: hypothetical protein FKN15_029332 [Acipenser sinensis]
MAQVLEHLTRQQATPLAQTPAPPPASAPEPTPAPPVVAPDVSVRCGDERRGTGRNLNRGFLDEMEGQELTQETGPSSEVTSETDITFPSSSILVLMEQTCNFLQVSWMAAPEQRCSIFRQASNPQPFLVFADFRHRLALAPSVLKQAAPPASLEGTGALGLAEFPAVDSTIAALM